MQEQFFRKIEQSLSVERLESYATDNPGDCIVLARYLLNMALCESLYSPLQLCEVALRNSIHHQLCEVMNRDDWYNEYGFLQSWASGEVVKAKRKMSLTKKIETTDRIVAELQFGFWTSLFESYYEENTIFLPSGIKGVFPYLPKSMHNRKKQKRILDDIRKLRNHVFHHERILHWRNLDEQHINTLSVIGWISPELYEMALALDRYSVIRKEGLIPWIDKIRYHWPKQIL